MHHLIVLIPVVSHSCLSLERSYLNFNYDVKIVCVAGIDLLQLLMPIMVSFLVDPSALSSASAITRRLHDNVLQRLIKIGPQYPTQFRQIMQTCPDLKARLEAAIKAQQQASQQAQQQHKAGARGVGAPGSGSVAAQPAKPSIKLKMDFSNFGAR